MYEVHARLVTTALGFFFYLFFINVMQGIPIMNILALPPTAAFQMKIGTISPQWYNKGRELPPDRSTAMTYRK